MIFKKSVVVVAFCIAWIDGISGTSYSQVYVNSGSNGPYQYAEYGAPKVAYSAPIAKLSAAPVGSIVPYNQAANFIAPCVTPCVVQQPAAPVANAAVVAYTAPRASVVVARDVPPNYEYSYAVYDDGTGDQKTARELSDGGVVRGQYSFLQPDGYVREVQYTADDVTGFNAVVNYLPGSVEKTVDVKEAKPCSEVKPEALKQAESGEISVKETSTSSEVSSKEASSAEKVTEESPAESSEALAPEAPVPEASAPETRVPTTEVQASSSNGDENKTEESKREGSNEETPVVEAATDGKVSAEVIENKENSAENAIVVSIEEPQPAPAITLDTLPPGYVSYEQLLKCIKKMQNTDLRLNSPLTYILLPSNARLC